MPTLVNIVFESRERTYRPAADPLEGRVIYKQRSRFHSQRLDEIYLYNIQFTDRLNVGESITSLTGSLVLPVATRVTSTGDRRVTSTGDVRVTSTTGTIVVSLSTDTGEIEFDPSLYPVVATNESIRVDFSAPTDLPRTITDHMIFLMVDPSVSEKPWRAQASITVNYTFDFLKLNVATEILFTSITVAATGATPANIVTDLAKGTIKFDLTGVTFPITGTLTALLDDGGTRNETYKRDFIIRELSV